MAILTTFLCKKLAIFWISNVSCALIKVIKVFKSNHFTILWSTSPGTHKIVTLTPQILFLAFSLIYTCSADQPRSYNPEPSYGPANYDFSWSVLDSYSKNNFGQESIL
jgi:hypothetical protein